MNKFASGNFVFFWKQKVYILIHSWLMQAGRWLKILTWLITENKTTFFGLNNLAYHIVFTVKQLGADGTLFFVAQNAKTWADEFNSYLKANPNGHK